MNTGDNRMRSIRELSEALGMNNQVVWRYCHEGRIDAVRVGRNWKIPAKIFDLLVRGKITVRPKTEEKSDSAE